MIRIRYHAASQNAGVALVAILIIVVLFLLCCVVLGFARGERRRANETGSSSQKAPLNASDFMQTVIPQRPPSVSGLGTGSVGRASAGSPLTSGMPPPRPDAFARQAEINAFGLSPWSPLPTQEVARTSPRSAAVLPPTPAMGSTDMLASVADIFTEKSMPPPLCPNVVLPNCEVRVGVPMHELGKINMEGELTIVGLSGNPLLRAALRKAEGGRVLEISMPEPRSAPRAVVGPTIQDTIGSDKTRSRAVRICGMKGAFYGMLEMRSTGACYVIKDGQTVLVIDGDSESLQLAIKSGQGAPLAAVTCSSEPFGGAEHLEIRVQPGVDTVLVLACVLSVVLLSPYPPSEY